MARPVQGGSILEVTNVGNCNTQRLMNVWHYRFDGASIVTADGDAITDLLANILQPAAGGGLMGGLRGMCNEICTWERIRYQWIAPLRYSPVDNFTFAGASDLEDEPLPQNVAGVVTLKSIFAGPANTGRKHFGGLSVSDEAAGLMTNQFFAAAGVIMGVMEDTVDTGAVQAGSTLVPVIYDRAVPANSIPWVEWITQDTSRVMRRRTVRVGI